MAGHHARIMNSDIESCESSLAQSQFMLAGRCCQNLLLLLVVTGAFSAEWGAGQSQDIASSPLVTGDDLPNICSIFSTPVAASQTEWSILEGVIFSFHKRYSLAEQVCSEFLDWEAFQQAAAMDFTLYTGGANLPAVLEEISTYAFFMRDSCSSNLLAASQTQTILSVERGQVPGASLGQLAQQRVANLNLNITALRGQLASCNSLKLHRQAVCAVLNDLVEIATDPNINMRNETLRNLTRNTLTGERETLSDVLFDPDAPAVSSLFTPLTSREVIAISPVLSARHVLHISAWASSPTFDNINEYPAFYRMSPSDDHQVEAIVDLLTELEATYVSLIAGADDLYSGHGFNLLLEKSRSSRKFCYAVQHRISSIDNSSSLSAARAIASNPDARVVIIFATPEQMSLFIPAFNSFNITGRIVIGSSDWFNRLDYSTIPVGSPFYNSVTFGFVPAPEVLYPDIGRAVHDFKRSLRNASALRAMAERNTFVRQYVQKLGECTVEHTGEQVPSSCMCTSSTASSQQSPAPMRQCGENFTLPAKQFTVAPVTLFMANALGIVLQQTGSLQPICIGGTCEFLPFPAAPNRITTGWRNLELECTRRDGSLRRCRVFTDKQSGYPFYELRVMRSPGHTAATAQADLIYEGVGSWDGTDGGGYDSRLHWYTGSCVDFGTGGECVNMTQRRALRHLSNNSSRSSTGTIVSSIPLSVCSVPCPRGRFLRISNPEQFCCWQCIECTTGEVSTRENSPSCSSCSGQLVPSFNRSVCIPPIIRRWPWSDNWSWALLSLSVLGVLLSLSILAVFAAKRQEPMIIKSSLPHMTVILISAACYFTLSGTLLFVDNSTSVRCYAHRWTKFVFTVLSLSALLFKTHRIKQIFKANTPLPKLAYWRRTLLNSSCQVGMVVAAAFIMVSIVAAFSAGFPIQPTLVFLDERTAAYICNEPVLGNVIILILATLVNLLIAVFAFQARNLPDDYNESKLILTTGGVCLIVLAALLPSLLTTGEALRAVVINLVLATYHFAVLTTLCVPRVYWSVFGFAENYVPPRTSNSIHSNNGGYPMASPAARTPSSVSDSVLSECGCHCHQRHRLKPLQASSSLTPPASPSPNTIRDSQEMVTSNGVTSSLPIA